MMHNLINRAITHQQSGRAFIELNGLTEAQTQALINGGDHGLAFAILDDKFRRAGKTVRDTWNRVVEEMKKETEEQGNGEK